MKIFSIVTICLGVLLLSACELPQDSPSAEPFPDIPILPPAPTVVSPAVIGEYLTDARVAGYDPFDDTQNWNYSSTTGALQDGTFELNGSAGWQSSFWPKQQFKEGQGLVLRFQVKRANARSEFVFVTGDWLSDSFRQFGVYNAVVPMGDLFQGRQDMGGYKLTGNLKLESDTWYELLLAVGRNGHFLAVVWNPNDTAQRAIHDLEAGPNWAGRSWVFLPKANAGETVLVDDFYRLTLGDVR